MKVSELIGKLIIHLSNYGDNDVSINISYEDWDDTKKILEVDCIDVFSTKIDIVLCGHKDK